MIANAKAVAHGIRAMLYVSGESRNKKHPEKITRICDNFMPQGMDATGIWTEMKFASMNHPNIKNNVIRMEISPAMEHTENFTVDDWRQLWNDFAAAFDSQEIRDKDGYVVSPRTNVSGSKSSVWLHEESKSGIPHLHAIVCRVDENGNINNDHAIHLRAQRAAERSHGKGAGLPPCAYTRRTFHRSAMTAWKPCASLTDGRGRVTPESLPPKVTSYTCARTRRT